jgi:hypothetical protein
MSLSQGFSLGSISSGLILRKDSPNGKRYARQGRAGELNEAFGFSLAPLLSRAQELEGLAGQISADRELFHANPRADQSLLTGSRFDAPRRADRPLTGAAWSACTLPVPAPRCRSTASSSISKISSSTTPCVISAPQPTGGRFIRDDELRYEPMEHKQKPIGAASLCRRSA